MFLKKVEIYKEEVKRKEAEVRLLLPMHNQLRILLLDGHQQSYLRVATKDSAVPFQFKQKPPLKLPLLSVAPH